MHRLLAGVILLVACAAATGQERPFVDVPVADWVKRLQDPNAESRVRTLDQILFLTTVRAHRNPLYPVIVDMVKDPDAKVRDAATRVLTRSHPAPDTEPALKERLKDKELRAPAAMGLLRLDRNHPEAGAVWLEVVGNPKEQHRLLALSGITQSELPKGGADVLRKLAQDEDAEFRYQAFQVLTRYGSAAIPALREGVRDPVVKVKVQALTSLAKLQDRNTVGTFVDALKDPSLRSIAVSELLRLGELPETAAPALVAAFKDAAGAERHNVALLIRSSGAGGAAAVREVMKGTDVALQLDLLNLLARGGLPFGPVAQSIRLALDSPVPEARLQALRLLTDRVGEPLPTKELEKHLGDPSPRVRLVAAEVLAKRGDAQPEPLVATLLDPAAKDPDPAVREETGTILRQMADRSLSVLLKDLSSKDRATREKAALGIELLGAGAGSAANQLVPALKDDSRRVRRSIGNALLRLGPTAEPALQKALTDKDEVLRFAVVEALVTYEPPLGAVGPWPSPPVKELEPLLKHENVILRARAAGLLMQARPKEAEPVLLEALGSRDVAVRRAAAACLRIRSGGVRLLPGVPDASKALDLAKRDDDAGVRLYAAQVGSVLTHQRIVVNGQLLGPPPADLLCEGLKVDDEEIREPALKQLTYRAREAGPAAARLGELLGDPDPVVRKHAVYILSELGPGAAPALKPLLGMVKEPSPLLRQLAAQALGGTGVKEAVPVLIAALEDDEHNVRLAAVEGLGALGAQAGPAIPALVKLLVADRPADIGPSRPRIIIGPRGTVTVMDPFVRPRRYPSGPSAPYILTALSKIGPADEAAAVIPTLARRLQEGHSEAARALGCLGARAVPPLVEGLKNKETRLVSIMALGNIGPEAKDAAAPLARLLEDDDPEVRLQAAFALAQLGPAAREALSRLLPILADAKADLDLRLTAVQALGGIGLDAAAALPALRPLLKESNAALRAAAVRALGAVGGSTERALLEELRTDPSGLVRQAVHAALKRDQK